MSVSDLSIGSELLGYRVEGVLGRGGMSVVYLAEDMRLRRRVALKLLDPRLAEDAAFRERFLAESELAASLDHPCVIPIYAAGEADGRLFIAMRYVEGSDLKQLLRDGPLSAQRAVAICSQIAAALDFAHGRGLVHRDVKPSNVLLDAHEHVYLADFGLTKRLGEPRAVEPGLLGTIDYVAPEQIRGDEVDGRADEYSLGCLLCECLTANPPFVRSTDAAVLFAHLEEDPAVPAGLEQVVARALAKEPGDRYDSCTELVEAAGRALGVGEPAKPWLTRLPVLVTLLGVVLLAVGLVVYLALSGGGASPPPTSGVLVRVDPGNDRVVARVAVGNGPSAVAADANAVWVANHADGTVWRIDPRSNRILLRSSAQGAPADLAIIPPGMVTSPGSAILVNGPDAPNIVGIDAASEAAVVDNMGGNPFPSPLPGSLSGYGSPRVAAGPSGVWVARPDGEVGRFDVDAGKIVAPLLITRTHDETQASYLSAIAVSADGVWVVGDPVDPRLWRIDPATGRLVATIRLPFAPTDVAVGDGAVWVTSELDDMLERIDPSTNRVTATIRVGRGAGAVAVGAGAVWVADEVDRAISRVDPRATRITATIKLDLTPVDVDVANGVLWVAARRS
jgi:DNA-binding beta-propeller fold protein YncE/tRNA A-37 threonylcarbamoyl transferase component Bud32